MNCQTKIKEYGILLIYRFFLEPKISRSTSTASTSPTEPPKRHVNPHEIVGANYYRIRRDDPFRAKNYVQPIVPNTTGTYLDRLNQQCLLLICEHLGIVDLANLAALRQDWQRLIGRHIIKRKFHLGTGQVRIRLDQDEEYTMCSIMHTSVNHEDGPCIEHTDSIDDTIAVIKSFGYMFNKATEVMLTLAEEILPRFAAFAYHIEKYCTNDYNVTLYACPTTSDLFNLNNYAFPNAIKLRMTYFRHYAGRPVVIAHTYRRIQTLETDVTSHLILDEHMPTLRDFISFEENPPKFTQMLRCNPQLRNFRTTALADPIEQRELSVLLPNLESLYVIQWWSIGTQRIEQPIRFPRVRYLILNIVHFLEPFDDTWKHNLHSLQFDCLDVFELRTIEIDDRQFLLDFIAMNPSLKSVEIESLDLSWLELRQLVRALPILETLKMRIGRVWELEPLGIFFRMLDGTTVKQVVLCSVPNTLRRQKLKTFLPDEWVIVITDFDFEYEYTFIERGGIPYADRLDCNFDEFGVDGEGEFDFADNIEGSDDDLD